MGVLRRFLCATRNLLRGTRNDRELDQELRAYVNLLTDEKIAAGAPPERARREALIESGGIEQVKEEVRAVRAGALFEQLLHDVRYAIRGLRHSPAFTITVIVTLALGIGANTGIFSVIDALLFRPLPLTNPHQLAAVYRGSAGTEAAFSYPDYTELAAHREVLAGAAAWGTNTGWMRSGADLERASVHLVSPNYFAVLGVTPQAGRTFVAEPESASVGEVVLSDRTWRTRFNSDPLVAGRQVTLGGQAMTIAGVAPPSFVGLDPATPADAWITFPTLASLEPDWNFRARNEIWLRVIVRVQEDVSIRSAESVLQEAGSRIASGAPKQLASALRLVPASSALFDPTMRESSSRLATLVAGVAGLVLLIACANVANLLVVRATSRRRELGVRLAIGASRGRVARQILTESLVLGAAGCASALLVANWTIGVVTALAPVSVIPPGVTVALDVRIAIFATAVSLALAVLCALVPAWQASRLDLLPVVKGATANDPGPGAGVLSLRRALVVVQVALSAVLLVGAGLFIRTLGAALAVEPGYDVDRVLLTTVDFGAAGIKPAIVPAAGERILDEVRALPGVETAAFGHIVPFSGAFVSRPAAPETASMSADEENRFLVPYAVVSHDYFSTLGMRLRGRDFSPADGPEAPRVLIINQALADRHWPGQEAIGKRMKLSAAPGPLYDVIGVVPNGKYVSLTEEQHPYMYLPWAQSPRARLTLHVRTTGSPVSLAGPVRGAVRAVDPDVPALAPRTLRDYVDRSIGSQRVVARLLFIFGGIALAVGAVGVYGLTAYTIAHRRKELGVRVALGAGPADLVRMLVSQSLAVVALGLVIGMGAALLLARLVASMLFGVTGSDPVSFAAASGVLALTTLAATLIPTRRATRADPLAALRAD